MRLVLWLVLRSWRGNRLRSALTVLGVALGVAVVVAIHVMDHNTIQSRLLARNPDFGRVDFELTPKDRRADPAELSRWLEERDDVGPVGLLHATPVEIRRDGAVLGTTRLVGLAPLPNLAFAHYQVADGRDLGPSDGDGGILVGAAWAERLGVGIGDRLVLHPVRVADPTACIEGERVPVDDGAGPAAPQPVEVRGILARYHLGRRDGATVVLGSLPLARRLGPEAPTLFQVNRAYGADPDRLRSALEGPFVVHDERSALLGESSDERAFRNGVKLLGGLALVLGMFVVFQTLSQTLVERLRQIGLLRCLGTSSRQVAGVFLTDAALTAVLGTTLGVALGVGLAWLLQRFEFSSLGMQKDWQLHELPLGPILGTAALGIGFTLAGAAFPLWRVRSLPTLGILHARGVDDGADVLKGVNLFLFALLVLVLPVGYLATTTLLSDSAREMRLVLLQLVALLLVFGIVLLLAPQVVRTLGRAILWPIGRIAPLAGHLVDKTLRRRTGQVSASVCSLALVLVAGIALESLTTALHGDARRFAATAMKDGLFVDTKPAPAAEVRERFTVDGVRQVEALIGPVHAPFPISAVDPERIFGPGAPLAGRAEDAARFARQRCVIVSSRLARLRQLTPGGAVSVTTDGGPVAYTVLAVDDRVGWFPDEAAFALTHPRWLEHDFCVEDGAVRRAVVRIAADADESAVLARLKERRPEDRFKRSSWLLDYALMDVTRDFRLFQVLLGLILGLAGLGVVNAMTIRALGRTREIGVLRALGTSRRQLGVAFLVEGVLVGGLAALVALALGVPLGRLVVRGMNEVAGLDAPYLVPVHALVAAPVLAILVGAVAAVLPGRRASRVDPARAVRFE